MCNGQVKNGPRTQPARGGHNNKGLRADKLKMNNVRT